MSGSTPIERSQFERTESDVRDGSIGVRDFDAPTPEPDQSGDRLVVDEIHTVAEGNNHEDLNDEYIVFRHTGSEPLDLSGWAVSDKADHTDSVPASFELDSGATVTLYTVSGDDTDSKLYWGQGSADWNNDGDAIYVTDEDGETVIERSYD